MDVEEEELEFLIHQVWKNRCATTGLRIGGHAPLVLSRWDPEQPPTVSNLVLTTQAEASKLDKDGRAALTAEVCEYIDRRLLWARNVYEDDAFGSIKSLSASGEIGLSSASRVDRGATANEASGGSTSALVGSALAWFAVGALSATAVTRMVNRS